MDVVRLHAFIWETNCVCDWCRFPCHFGSHFLILRVDPVCDVVSCVQTMVRLPVLGIVNMKTDVSGCASHCTWGGEVGGAGLCDNTTFLFLWPPAVTCLLTTRLRNTGQTFLSSSFISFNDNNTKILELLVSLEVKQESNSQYHHVKNKLSHSLCSLKPGQSVTTTWNPHVQAVSGGCNTKCHTATLNDTNTLSSREP